MINEVRTNGQSKDAKIIIFSNLGQEDNIEKAMKLGANGYIVKADIGINELLGRIIKELSN